MGSGHMTIVWVVSGGVWAQDYCAGSNRGWGFLWNDYSHRIPSQGVPQAYRQKGCGGVVKCLIGMPPFMISFPHFYRGC